MRKQTARRRAALQRAVYQDLRRANFRELLSARDADNMRPIVCALAEDPAKQVLDSIIAMGGNANLVIGVEGDAMLVAAVCVSQDLATRDRNAVSVRVSRSETILELMERTAEFAEGSPATEVAEPVVRVGHAVRLAG